MTDIDEPNTRGNRAHGVARENDAARESPRSTRGHRATPTPHRSLHLHILGSGSKGNCAVIEGPSGLIMIDDGFSRKQVVERLHELDLDEDDVRALIVTHEHSDHVSGVAVWSRRFEGELLASAGTPEARQALGDLSFTTFMPGDILEVAGVRMSTFPTLHDVVNPVGLRFDCDGDSIGICTDTGVLTPGARRALAGVRVLGLESNHDIPMLRTGRYPRALQDRIASERGHLSNDQAASAARELVSERTECVVALHISQENNRPSLAVRAIAGALGATLDDELGSSATLVRAGDLPDLRVRAAGQNRPISIW